MTNHTTDEASRAEARTQKTKNFIQEAECNSRHEFTNPTAAGSNILFP